MIRFGSFQHDGEALDFLLRWFSKEQLNDKRRDKSHTTVYMYTNIARFLFVLEACRHSGMKFTEELNAVNT